MAHAFIDAVASAGADAVKFQTHIAAAESTPAEPWRARFSFQDKSRYDYWKRMEFSEEQWRGLARHARDKDLLFLSSPFSLEAAELLLRVGVPAWKVASGELSNAPLLDRLLASKKPVLASTGMSALAEIDKAVKRVQAAKVPLVLMQCSSLYPCPPESVGLRLIEFFRRRYRCEAGLSDHSGTVYPGLAAAALGCSALEVHVALSRDMFGPDIPASLTPQELSQLVKGVRFIEAMNASGASKNELSRKTAGLRPLFTKSVAARVRLSRGAVLRREHLALKKPGTGIPAAELERLLGRRLKKDVPADALLKRGDLA
ncbi:MAG: N-acetylneuraminate synthase family protein [Elusimicrobia bacterium]|nr:N-acetylneuraminate synthase family protein [Elusimicrobiota bacterium]